MSRRASTNMVRGRIGAGVSLALMAGALALGSVAAHAQAQGGTRYGVLIGGLGGETRYTEAFRNYLFETRRAFIGSMGFEEKNVTVLAEASIADQPFVDDVSTAENIRAALDGLASRVGPRDEVYVVLFGHGSYDGERARLNIPRADLSDEDFDRLLDRLAVQRIVFVNTASASGPFATTLSGAGRIVIAATRAGSQRNATIFPQYFVAGLTDPSADFDKDGDLSVAELFRYAAGRTEQYFTSSGTLATEFAVLEDTGDGEPARLEALEGGQEGVRSSAAVLRRGIGPASLANVSDPALAPYLLQREDLEREIAEWRARKAELEEGAYYEQLERLFVRLARVNERIER